MRDDHFRRRDPRASPAARSGAAGTGPGPVAGSDPGPSTARPVDRGLRGLLIAIGVCIAGCAVLLAVGGSNIVTFIAISLGGIAFVLVLAAVFYAVGRSEDRERAQRTRTDA